MSNIAKMALLFNLYLLLTLNIANANLITLEIIHEDADATGAKIHVLPPQSDGYTIDIDVETTEIEFELNEIGLYEFTAQSFDNSGNSSEETEPIYYEVKSQAGPESDDKDDNAGDNEGYNDIDLSAGSCFLTSCKMKLFRR